MNGDAVIIRCQNLRTLYHSEQFWMSDAAIHDESMRELSDQAYGDVICGGYGLGLLQRHLTNNPRVTSVTTVEINPDVIRVVLLDDQWIWGSVVIADFLSYRPGRKWDCVIGDLWADVPSDTESLDAELYRGFLARASDLVKPDGRVLAWNGSW